MTLATTEKEFERQVRVITHSICSNDSAHITKSLWRISGGSRSKAFQVMMETCKHYSFDLTEDVFDEAVARLAGDGCEFEWGC